MGQPDRATDVLKDRPTAGEFRAALEAVPADYTVREVECVDDKGPFIYVNHERREVVIV